jgi:hypothetical protein
MELLIEFEFEITYIKGKTNVVSDALSRTPKHGPSPEHQNLDTLDKVISKTSAISVNAIHQLELSAEYLKIVRPNTRVTQIS